MSSNFRDRHPGIAIDEVQHPVVGTSEGELGQNFIRVADEVPIREK